MKGYILRARFNGLVPFLPDFDVLMDLCIEFLYMYVGHVRRRRGAEGVSFNNELFGGISEVRDVTLRDVAEVLRILRNKGSPVLQEEFS